MGACCRHTGRAVASVDAGDMKRPFSLPGQVGVGDPTQATATSRGPRPLPPHVDPSRSKRWTHRCTLGGMLLHDVAKLRALASLVLRRGLVLVLVMLGWGLVLLGGGAQPHGLVERGSRSGGVEGQPQTVWLRAEGLHGELGRPCWGL